MRATLWFSALVLVACGGGTDLDRSGATDAATEDDAAIVRRPLGDPCDPRGGEPRCPVDVLTDAGVFQVVCYREADAKMYARCTLVCDWVPETEIACRELGGECVQPEQGGRRICTPR